MITTLLITILLSFSIPADPVGLKVGEKAPDFIGIDQNGKEVRLSESLKSGKVILTFYRGAWCRYCMAQFKDYQDSLSIITDTGTSLIAISPEHEDGIQKTANTSKAEFSLIHDDGLKIMLDYKVISEERVDEYEKGKKETGEDNQQKFLPVPATYIIDQEGIVEYVYFDPNYKVRVYISTLLEYLK